MASFCIVLRRGWMRFVYPSKRVSLPRNADVRGWLQRISLLALRISLQAG